MKKQVLYKLSLFLISILFAGGGFSQQTQSTEQIMQNIIISNEVIVRMHKGMDPNSIIREVPSSFELKIDRVLSKRSDIWLLNFNDQVTNVDEVLSIIRKNEDVWLAQKNTKVDLRVAPNDPQYGNQWQHNNIDSEAAWDITTGGTTSTGDDIVVCVIESADVMGHPDLQNNHWTNSAETPNNGVDDDGNGYIDDYNGWNVGSNDDNLGTGGHGTAVAGMIGAQGNNNLGVAGANWDVKIMVVAGYGNPFTQANIVEAYTYPMEARILWNQTNGTQGSFVVSTNASWGVDGGDPNDYPIWCSFYDDLGQAGILNCGATTNQSQDVDTFGDVPTACASDYMVGVTATDNSDQITFAGYGDQTINVAAPGDNIYSTSSNGNYSNTSGTSFASPLTAGVIGLLYSIPCTNFMSMVLANPQGTADIVRNALYNGVDQSPHLQARTVSGGRINAKTSIDLLMAQVCSSCTPPGNITTNSVNDNDATIGFDNVTDANQYIIYIQEAGTGIWSSFTTTDLTYTFSGLSPCTEYEYYIESDCGSETSISSATLTFNTTGCGNCTDLPYCSTGTTANPGVFVGVHSPANVETEYNNYTLTSGWGADLEVGFAYGDLVLVDDGSVNSEEGCNALINGAAIDGNIAVVVRGNCNFSLKALNAQNAGATGLLVINNQANSPTELGDGGQGPQINIPVVMVSQADGTNLLTHLQGNGLATGFIGQQNEWIESFEIDGNSIISGDDFGYRAPDITPISLNIGQNYTFTLTPGFDGQNLNEYSRIWLDIDQSGTFDVNELIYDQVTGSFGQLSDNVFIPLNTLPGSSRMRVQMSYQGYGSNPLSTECGDFTSGEVEDYCVDLKTIEDASIEENEKSLNVVAYPNPANDLIYFKIESTEAARIIIYDPTGKIISSTKIDEKLTKVNLHNFNTGLYIYQVKDKSGNILHINKINVVK
jgi:hypothetical protein